MPNSNAPQTKLRNALKIDGTLIEDRYVFDISIQADLDQPDMAAITLSNGKNRDGKTTPSYAEMIKEGAPVELKLWLQAMDGQNAPVAFAGEVVGIEPVYAVGQAPRVVIRCMNGLHRLTRGTKSRTFPAASDADIAKQVVSAYDGLSVDFGDAGPKGPTTTYKHVYQHNQTDLEFLRHRASRIGFEVLVDSASKKVFFRPPGRKKVAPPLEYKAEGDASLQSFFPRLSTTAQVAGVNVRSWDPEQKTLFIGTAKPKTSTLGKIGGAEASQDIMSTGVDVPVQSQEEADNVARSILLDRQLSYILADATCVGNYELRPGDIVTIKVDDTRFAGDYYIMSLVHSYAAGTGANTGFKTRLKLRRDAQGTLDASNIVMTPLKAGAAIQG